MSELLSPRNPHVAQARQLARDRRLREETGLSVLEGIRLAEEAVATGVTWEYALYTDSLLAKERGEALLALLMERRVPVHRVSEETLSKAADTTSPQGIIGVFSPRTSALTELGRGLVVVLDGLQDPGNLGTVIRSVEAMGGVGVVVAGGVDPHSPKVVRAAMGSLFRLPVVKAPLDEALSHLKFQGRPVYVADAGGNLQPWQAKLAGEAVLIIGNEGNGPSAAAHAAADGVISIPMPGGAESLNAGIAASLLIYEALRQRSS